MSSAAAAAAAAGPGRSPVLRHPDQLCGDRDKRETFVGVFPARRDHVNGKRGIDVARALSRAHGELPMWATDIPRDPTGVRHTAGVKCFHVASYSAWADYYGRLPPDQRFSYEIVRILPTRFYVDIDVDRKENEAMTHEVFVNLRAELVRMVREEVTRVVTSTSGRQAAVVAREVEELCSEVVVLDSTRPHKISQHLVFPNLVLRNPFHCGALLRRVQVRLLRKHELSPGAGDSNNDHPFFIWSRIKNRAATGETVRVRNFFGDLAVYTRDRNFRVYWSRKNIAGALPLLEEGSSSSSSSTFNWDIYNKTLLQRVPRLVPVIDCMELDGSLPVSTSNANLHRYDIPGAGASAAAAAAVVRAPVAATVSAAARETVVAYWRDAFPFDILWYLAPAGGGDAAREFSFVFPQNRWSPACTFRSVDALRDAVLKRCPAQIHVGLVVASAETTRCNPTLAFDVDVDDYAPFRPCCKSEKKACARCWPILEFAQLALRAFLHDYGMDDVLFFFSGSKGVHAWVTPASASAARVACSTPARNLLADDFESVYRDPITDANSREELGGGGDTYNIPDFQAAIGMREFTLSLLGNAKVRARWRRFVCVDMELKDIFERHESRHGTASALAHVLWPSIDGPVTRDPRHKIKAPFSVHARTGRVAVWLPSPEVSPFSAEWVNPTENARALREHLGLASSSSSS